MPVSIWMWPLPPSKEHIDSADTLVGTLISALNKADTQAKEYPINISYIELQGNEREAEIKRSLNYAVENNLVEPFLQPLICAETGKLIGAEVLARIKDPEGYYISPALFIPIAEQNGKINEIGEQIFEKVCQEIQDGLLTCLKLSFINVNLSPMQFMRSDLASRYSSIVKKYGIDPEMIHQIGRAHV